jgi:hypothetical protein
MTAQCLVCLIPCNLCNLPTISHPNDSASVLCVSVPSEISPKLSLIVFMNVSSVQAACIVQSFCRNVSSLLNQRISVSNRIAFLDRNLPSEISFKLLLFTALLNFQSYVVRLHAFAIPSIPNDALYVCTPLALEIV